MGDMDANSNNKRRTKSPKPIENPLLNKNHQFVLGGSRMDSAPSLLPENESIRNPLGNAFSTGIRSQQQPKTPGPPPTASLSLSTVSLPPPATDAPTAPLPLAAGESMTSNSKLRQLQQNEIASPSIQSPEMIRYQQPLTATETSLSVYDNSISGNNNHWVVAYGYTNQEEFEELLYILSGYGTTVTKFSNRNWLALQYECRTAAEKALCSQPIILKSASLCGTVRGSKNLLERLRSQPSLPPLLMGSSTNKSLSSYSSFNNNKNMLMMEKNQALEEQDILAQYNTDRSNGDYYDQDTNMDSYPASICEQLFSWYFGWNNNDSHAHLD